tara:strand:+ start:208 stop:327 length:120 start_codon:yes stop_codon:yes gene_type:complete
MSKETIVIQEERVYPPMQTLYDRQTLLTEFGLELVEVKE